jgi:succinyl-CoA synthetase beta subunit
MKLLEHESKKILAVYGIPTPKSKLFDVTTGTLPVFPLVLKSQVPTGGRGKAGGIQIIKTQQVLKTKAAEFLALDIKGFTPKTLLAEELLDIKNEYYLSLMIDRASASIQLMAHIDGGIEVEDNHNFWTRSLEEPFFEQLGQELADYLQLPEQTFVLQDLLENLYRCFVESDATLIEINPLVLTADDKLVAGDCKMTLDDAAAFRHDRQFEEQPAESNFVTIDPNGTVATIANGAGLAMATVDAAYDTGLTPANFLDIGGGATTETLLAAFNKIVEYQDLQAIIINIFAGITRADEVAKAIIAAREQISDLPPLFIRIAGTNVEAASELLAAENIPMLESLEACLAAAKESING